MNTDDFEDDAAGWASRWKCEIDYAKDQLKEWKKQANDVVKAFLDERTDIDNPTKRLNLFNANITTLKAMLYGRVPEVSVDRRYADADDDVARVASVILERLLNLDMETAAEDYSAILRSSLEDYLLCGFGLARCRYDFETEDVEVEAVHDELTGLEIRAAETQTNIKQEWVDDVYIHWEDCLWSPCRTWSELRWFAFRSYLDKEEIIERFGEEIAEALPMDAKSPIDNSKESGTKKEIWSKAEVWEIWNKKERNVYWYTKGYGKILDKKDDPLKLENFWPFPRPMVSNVTTKNFVPKPDYVIAQDLYKEVDDLQERITNLTAACKVIGCYDKNQTGSLGQMLKPGTENQMIPVDNWAMFSEKGGIKGTVDFLPLDQVILALEKLMTMQADKMNQLNTINGMADILRGQGDPDSSATQDSITAKMASIRVQAIQEDFARFATDLSKIKFEIMAKHFQPQTIIDASNIMESPDAATPDLIQSAVQLLQKPGTAAWKLQIRPEAMAMLDYSQIRQERTEYINALGLFMQSAAPITQQAPSAAPILMELLKWGLAGFKGSQTVEGVIDRAIAAMEKEQAAAQATPPAPPPPDPKLQAVQAKAQSDQAVAQTKMVTAQQTSQADMQKQAQEHQLKMSEMVANFQMEMNRMRSEHEQLIAGHSVEMNALSNKSDYQETLHAHKLATIEAQEGTPVSE